MTKLQYAQTTIYYIHTEYETIYLAHTAKEAVEQIQELDSSPIVMKGDRTTSAFVDVTQELLESAYEEWEVDADEDATPPAYLDNFDKLDEYEEYRKQSFKDSRDYMDELTADYRSSRM
jgi:hypothetical protein